MLMTKYHVDSHTEIIFIVDVEEDDEKDELT